MSNTPNERDYKNPQGQFDKAGLDNFGRDHARTNSPLPNLDQKTIVERQTIQESYNRHKQP